MNRSSKEIAWTLGREDDYSILYEQHNPDLVGESPPTVLIADSENDRVVEYRKEVEGWNRTWSYGVGLNWPRDADRLPNGNTLVTSSRAEQVLEVAPDGRVVWQVTTSKHPYDAERLWLPDGSAGPTMAQRDQFHEITASTDVGLLTRAGEQFRRYHDLSQWVLPVWIGLEEFAALHVSLFSLIALGVIQLRRWSADRNIHARTLLHNTAAIATFVIATGATVFVPLGTGVFAGLAVVSGLNIESRVVRTLSSDSVSLLNEIVPDGVTRTRVRALGAVAFSLLLLVYATLAFPVRDVLIDDNSQRQMAFILHLAVAGIVTLTGLTDFE